ncbi:proline and serine-rich protein 2 [Cyprinodon tularosa]|uniref:proline and serine-rich protein 2 n=1 Tax=Cyprinodon tularosa TaxID=77115 RepID=UPI0018E238EA|nr:proline and serine-rich protein 2 [Cyprinodon tularosa]
MDVHLQGNSQLHYRVNGGTSQNAGPGGDNTLHILSPEEQECLQFFEETIESLEESLDEEKQRLGQRRAPEHHRQAVEQVDGLPSLAPNHDIIDLVHPEPDLVHTKEPIFNPTDPDFRHMVPPPESHFDIKPRHDSFSPDYNPPLRSASFGPSDTHSSYHPPGSVPTPVLIAQKIAENQGDGTSNLHSSPLLRRLSDSSEKSPGDRSNYSVKHGPPTSAKPSHYPPNINVVLGGKEHQKPVTNVNMHERQEQMLANLAGTSHPLVQNNSKQGLELNAQNSPSRSISFRDPAPDQSRMEALSKLGLTRVRAASLQMTPDTSSQVPLRSPDHRAVSPDTSLEPRAPIPPHPLRSHDERSYQLSPSSPTMSPKHCPSPPPAEVTSPAFNSFGGKSIVVHPSIPHKNEPPISPTSPEPKNVQLTPSNTIEHSPYGGKSKVITPGTAPVAKANLPDILSSHIDSKEPVPAKPERHSAELNKYGGKSRTFDPVSGLYRTSESHSKSVKLPPPNPAPKPPRHSYYGALPSQKPPARASSPEYRRRPTSMFRPQGITVQFCGRGAMDESRREALRRLGLLKDS